MLAYRLLLRRGEWDIDGFFRSIPASKWMELKVAHALIQSHDDWAQAVNRGWKKRWEPPEFGTKKVRRRLDGTAY